METIQEPAMQTKPIEYGEGLIVRHLDDKILISACPRTVFKDKEFSIDAEVIHVEAGPGIKISSKGNNTLVVSCDLTKFETKIYDMKQEMDKRLETIEKTFVNIIKQLKK